MLDSIYDCQNTKVCANVSAISNVGRGMSTDFDKAAAFLLPTDHVTKESNERKNVLSLRLKGPRVVLAPVGSAYIGNQIKIMEP